MNSSNLYQLQLVKKIEVELKQIKTKSVKSNFQITVD